LVLRFDFEAEVLDHVVRQQLPAHRLHALARLVLARALEVDLDVLADAHVGHLAEAERGQALLDGEPLRIVDHRFGGDDDSSPYQVSFLGFFGNSSLPTRRWYAVR